MTNYTRMYRFGIRPWERYGASAAARIAALLDREEAERPRPLGRALDLGCGRGQYTPELARRGWQAIGIDYVPAAIEAAKRRDADGAMYVVGDVTDLPAAERRPVVRGELEQNAAIPFGGGAFDFIWRGAGAGVAGATGPE